jgi:hypothetical protein
MHRASAGDNPLAPISHHFLDSTHVAHGVATFGFATKEGFKIEAAAFNGHEPDQQRWDIETPRLNSFAGRLTVNPHRDWSLQWSIAHLDEPEQLHRGLDVLLMTASATHNRRFASANWQTTVAWGRSKRETPPLPVLSAGVLVSLPTIEGSAHAHVMSSGASRESPIQRGLLLESAAALGRWHTIYTRFESAGKDEQFAPDDVRHATIYSVRRATVGYIVDLPFENIFRTGVGINASVMALPSDLKESYGDSPWGLALFLRVRLGP